MSGYILCQHKRARTPYFIENISTNIYSIEELCYYLYTNTYLIDHTIINEHLCDWLRDELGLVRLYRKLYDHLDRDESMSHFILPIFKEIHYLSHSEFKKVQETIIYIEALPQPASRKLKADYLVNNEMYAHAVKEYHQILKLLQTEPDMGRRFQASIWCNMGGAYARLFLFEDAAQCLEKAYQLEPTVQVFERYLCALRLSMTEEEFTKVVAKNYVKVNAVANLKAKMRDINKAVKDTPEYAQLESIKKLKKDGEISAYEESMKKLISKIRENYQKSTCF